MIKRFINWGGYSLDLVRHDPNQTWKLYTFVVLTTIGCILTTYFVVFTIMKMIFL